MTRFLLTLLLSTLTLSPAFAQYQWLDSKGRMVFSDMPPPHSIKKKNVIKGYKAPPVATSVQESADRITAENAELAKEQQPGIATAADLEPEKPSSAKRLADRLAEFDKRREARLEASNESAKQAKAESRSKELCRNLQNDNRALKSGRRLALVNAAGEREIIGDDARKVRLKENRELMSKHCNS
jgi:hypothetical protein